MSELDLKICGETSNGWVIKTPVTMGGLAKSASFIEKENCKYYLERRDGKKKWVYSDKFHTKWHEPTEKYPNGWFGMIPIDSSTTEHLTDALKDIGLTGVDIDEAFKIIIL